MSRLRPRWVLMLGVLLVPLRSWAACPPSCPVTGGGLKNDCQAEFAATALRLNYPPFDPAKPKAGKEVRCFDGEAGCDTDGVVNQECLFDVDVCLRNADPALPSCTPADVTAVTVKHPEDPDLAALGAALTALVPATTNVCTTGRTLRVPLKTLSHGRLRRASKSVALSAQSAVGVDTDKLRLTCVPHGWPAHGYNQANHRASGSETVLGPANAADLELLWHLDTGPGLSGVTSTPTVGNGLVYVTSWSGNVHAVNPSTGKVKWTYDAGDNFLGVQSSATLTADGRLVLGDSVAAVHCLNAKTGKLLWKTSLQRMVCLDDLGTPCTTNADCDPSICIHRDHVWGSPTVANGRVFVGIASHTDQPCTPGQLVALDLDSGAVLWTYATVPHRVCSNDTAIACTSDAECAPGTCVFARGAGITATVAVDASGEAVFMNTVGCYTFPSVGDSDSVFRLDAASGQTVWKRRVQPPEQFGICSNDGSIECGSDAACGAGTCTTKAAYHDFGFLNGPLLVDADDGMAGTRPLVVSGSKDGTLYAFDPADGSPVWTRAVVPTPVSPAFAGFGLFNGAIGFADQRFYAALYRQIPEFMPAPEHLMAFSAVDGSTVWSDEIGDSWGHVGLAGGLLFTGTEDAEEFYVYDATTGTRLKTFPMPATVTSGASIVGGIVYVGYGTTSGVGGVMAFALP